MELGRVLRMLDGEATLLLLLPLQRDQHSILQVCGYVEMWMYLRFCVCFTYSHTYTNSANVQVCVWYG